MILNPTAHLLEQTICIHTPKAVLEATLCVPETASAAILFAHHAGADRHTPASQAIAERLRQDGFATLQIELLTGDEQRLDVLGKLSYDIPLLAGRLDSAADWITRHSDTAGKAIGYFGAGTGAAAALVAALQKPDSVGAIVSLGGRMELAESVLPEIRPPTLFIAEPKPPEKLAQYQRLARKMLTEKKVAAIAGAESYFEEPEEIEHIAEFTASWFRQHLAGYPSCRREPNAGPHIDSCSFGRIRVDGKDYTRDLVILSEKQVMHWWRRDNHRVRLTDLRDVIVHRPELFIVGTGTLGNLKVEPSVRQMLHKYNIPYMEDKTQSAAVHFNKEISKGVKAAGAFHLTC